MSERTWHDSPPAESLRGRIVLLTGGGGFIGGHLARAIAAAGAELHCTALADSGEDAPPGVVHHVDLRDEATTRDLISEIQPALIFHLAGVVDTARAPGHVTRTLFGNLVTTVNVLLGALDAGVRRTVITGSSEELSEATAVNSPYAASKLGLPPYLDLFRSAYGLDVVSVRPFMAYGPGQPGHRFVPETTLSLLAGTSPVVRDPQRVCDFIHVRDVVDGMIVAGVLRDLDGPSFDVGTGVGTRIKDACETLRSLIPEAPRIVYDDNPPSCDPHVAFEHGRPVAGWKARITLENGLAETIDWYRSRRFAGPSGEATS